MKNGVDKFRVVIGFSGMVSKMSCGGDVFFFFFVLAMVFQLSFLLCIR